MKFHWGMKALIEAHFQHGFIENVLRSTLSYPNETSKECIQFLNESSLPKKKKKTQLVWKWGPHGPDVAHDIYRTFYWFYLMTQRISILHLDYYLSTIK